MTQPLSRYRAHARRLIAAALDALPPGATRRDAEKAITAASPYRGRFAGDGNSWASQCWTRERRAALRARFPDPVPKSVREVIRFELTSLPGGWPWLRVACGWCGAAQTAVLRDGSQRVGGCLQCLGHLARVLAVVRTPTFRALRDDAARDPALLGVLRDYLSEQGIDVGEKGP